MKIDLLLHFYNVTGIIPDSDLFTLRNSENIYTKITFDKMITGLKYTKFPHHAILAFDEIGVFEDTLKKWSKMHNVTITFGDELNFLYYLFDNLYRDLTNIPNVSLYLAGAGSSMVFIGHTGKTSPISIHHLNLELFSKNDVHQIASSMHKPKLSDSDVDHIINETGGIPRYVMFMMGKIKDGTDVGKIKIEFDTVYEQALIPSLKFLLVYEKIPVMHVPLKLYADMLQQDLPQNLMDNKIDTRKFLSVLGIPYKLVENDTYLKIKLPIPVENILKNQKGFNILFFKYICAPSEFMEIMSLLTLFELRNRKISWSFLSHESPLYDKKVTNITRFDMETQLKTRNIEKLGDILLQQSVKNEENILVNPADRSSTPDSFLILKPYNSIICVQDKNFSDSTHFTMNMICSELIKMLHVTRTINPSYHTLGIINVTNTSSKSYKAWFFPNSEKIDIKNYFNELQKNQNNNEKTISKQEQTIFNQLSEYEHVFDHIELYVLVGRENLFKFYNNEQVIVELYEQYKKPISDALGKGEREIK